MESVFRVNIYTSNIFCIRSKMATIYFNINISNCKITMSYVKDISSFRAGSNISITNCVIENDDSGIDYATYENNILTGINYRLNALKISAGTFRSNILLDRDAKVDIKSPNSQNNLAPNEQFGTANGNRAYEPANLFIGGTSSDGKYQIKATSPYVKAGFGGTQPGIFGGSEPYVLSGIPPIPIIYDLNVPGSGSTATGLNINVKIRGAN